MIKNINITYADKIEADADIEQQAKNNIQLWLGELADDFNKEGASVEVFIAQKDKHHISFDNISEDLKVKAYAQLKHFQVYY